MNVPKQSLDHVRVFGAREFEHVDKSKRNKLDKHAHKCMFIGYAEHSKAYGVCDLEDNRLVILPTVVFDERPPMLFNHEQVRESNRAHCC
ncbi:TPA: hypothetical protein N0F65_007538 [Lagenidium giganteum]|uniref:Retroviral polymerase SH3-like domain-containing protein n=1 Tax=Lagenidium giganteum TaxID=4803 RepID=A0AAV2ZHM2_9STRA|nr:TPA: hypothetical protein N0F65_007538 [Lagenidium giganteum]